ncbi:protein phosphatase 1 regulatory subunit 12A isoform X2 [Thalassophryne amazonica]|uniref:protein phosphatase 1 regulatory subunit 12A isoform X2 n=1 Tax=Thalassophryne amazonica TaxID=390379 RepID=UPI001471557E|nr:protein phosphatase 1 regulatory subunit 12A isoform X2 [Thalassophryne amazonica]XP_034019775.1 protein phosphatase 1 regulatory subunit 12A isoform X2 [Thalassophryne amazonica]
MKMADAKQKRNEQLKRWLGSETDQEPPILKKKKTKVKFDDGAVFLAACSSGDTEEVLRMLDRGADINYANVDGLTALHQACIDDNVDMVTFLVEHGASINQPDNEGWIPLHAAASCGYMDIAEYLISQGANVGVVNSEGETPLDIAEEEAMEELLQNEISRQGVDIEAARKEEERVMLRDARQWLNSGQIQDTRHTKSGGTALHVAAAKGYVEVLKLLIQAKYDVNIKDYDGWTPLHAAAHWGKEEACRILVENMCDMDIVNKMGQTAFDVADEDVLGYLEELQKKQNLLMSEKKDVKISPLIETTTTGDNNQSLKPLKSKETLLLEPEKTAPQIETLEPEKVDEEEEGKKDESSCSSEEDEEEDSESENEAEKNKTSVSVSNSTALTPASITVSSPTSPTNQVTTPTSPLKKVAQLAGKVSSKVEEERKDESPASWRQGLRKTGSYGALAEITAAKDTQREKDSTGVMRSASSPRLSSSLDNKDKDKEKDKGTRLAYVVPTIPRRLASTSDIDEKENRDSMTLIRSGSYTRRRWDDDLKNNEGSASINRTSSYQRSTSHTLALGRSGSTRDVPAKSSSTSSLDPNTCNTKPWQPPSSHYQSYSIYRSGSFGRRHEDLSSSTTSSSTTTTMPSSVTSPTGHRGLLSSLGSSSIRTGSTGLTSRYWSEESAEREKEKEKESAAVIPTINTGSTTTTTATTTTTVSTTTATNTTTTTTTTTTGTGIGSERRRSYLTPVRDEESESQRKARSRQARQSRRSTQGVTLTDLQEAEKTISRSRATRSREEEKEEKEKQDKEKQEEEKKETETKEDDYRSKYRSYEERYRPSSSSSSISTASSTSTPSYTSTSLSSSSLSRPNSLTGITSSYSRPSRDTEKETEKKEEEKEGEDKSQPRSIRDRRRPREKRRSTGVSFWTQDGDEHEPEQQSDSEEVNAKGEPESDRLSRNETSTTSIDRNDTLSSRSYGESRRPYSSRLDMGDSTDYKKLYEQILAENEKLKAQLRDTDLELADLKLQLEKATQRQERYADRSQLEMEKRERRALERKISEMEEELKNLPQMLPDLKADNQRLKDENGALIRVISKLSK